jgi:hypothetical protein
MDHITPVLIVFFLATTLVSALLLAKAVNNSRAVWIGSLSWIIFQSAIALTGFYETLNTYPPRLVLAVAPPLILIVILFLNAAGKKMIDRMDLKWCILFHTVRVLVEVNLYVLFIFKQVPAAMTLEHGNLDILVGVSAPIIYWAFSKGLIGDRTLQIWNYLCLASLLNAVFRALLSAPFPFQRFAFDQPTVAILYFPFNLLIAFIVPSALFCHLALARKLHLKRR